MWPVRAALSIAATTTIALIAIVSERGGALRPLLALALLAALALAASVFASRTRLPERSAKVAAAIAGLRDRIAGVVLRAHQGRRAAEDAREDKEEFLAAVSHELRTPLNSIQGFAQVLLSEIDGPLTPSQREDVDAIGQAGSYLKELIDEVIDASSRRTPAVERLELVDVARTIDEVVRLLEPQRRGKPIAIEIDVAPGVPPVPADPRRIRQILLNLGTNAIKYTREGKVRFVLRATARSVRVAVIDTGPGIAREDHGMIFRAFERVDTNRGRTEGWGLGLAIAREMAQRHGGRIEVESELGKGATFVVTLPLGTTQLGSPPPATPPLGTELR